MNLKGLTKCNFVNLLFLNLRKFLFKKEDNFIQNFEALEKMKLK
jgi:DNA-binding transcriptional regulator GbsR (MarR family)